MRKDASPIIGFALFVLGMGFLLVPSLGGQEVPRISAGAALHKYNSGTVMVIDAMNSRTYKKYHILGALSLPGDGKADLERIERAKLPIPKHQGILVYCD